MQAMSLPTEKQTSVQTAVTLGYCLLPHLALPLQYIADEPIRTGTEERVTQATKL